MKMILRNSWKDGKRNEVFEPLKLEYNFVDWDLAQSIIESAVILISKASAFNFGAAWFESACFSGDFHGSELKGKTSSVCGQLCQ